MGIVWRHGPLPHLIKKRFVDLRPWLWRLFVLLEDPLNVMLPRGGDVVRFHGRWLIAAHLGHSLRDNMGQRLVGHRLSREDREVAARLLFVIGRALYHLSVGGFGGHIPWIPNSEAEIADLHPEPFD